MAGEVHDGYILVHQSVLRVLSPIASAFVGFPGKLDRNLLPIHTSLCLQHESVAPCTKLNPELILCMEIGVDVVAFRESGA